MADIDRTGYECRICLTLGLAGAAVVTGIVVWIVYSAGAGPLWAGLVALVLGAGLLWAVDGFCQRRAAGTAGFPGRGWLPGWAERLVPGAVGGSGLFSTTKPVPVAEEPAPVGGDAGLAARGGPPDPRDPAVAAEERLTVEPGSDDRAEEAIPGTPPPALDAPRGGQADDLKRIRGIGPKLEELCNSLGIYHYDQIAAWTSDEVAWVDSHLGEFRGRVTRDDWVAQAKTLAAGGSNEPPAGPADMPPPA